MKQLERLIELAKAATMGTWYIEDDEVRVDLSPNTTDSGAADCSITVCTVGRISPELDPFASNREFIAAANPAAVMALCGALSEAVAALEDITVKTTQVGHEAGVDQCISIEALGKITKLLEGVGE